MSDLFRDYRLDWLRSVKASYATQGNDVTTTTTNAEDFQRPAKGCQHEEWMPIAGSTELVKCLKCWKVREV